MAESPISLKKIDCGNGKRKMIVREREYDVLSWHGLKTVVTVVAAVIGIVIAVLTTYYTAEAGQSAQISECKQAIATQAQRIAEHDKDLDSTFKRFDAALRDQRQLMDDTSKTVIRIDTQQKTLIKHVEKISDKLDRTR